MRRLAGILVLALLAAGCSGEEAPALPDPAAAVEALAAGLPAGDVAGIPFTDETRAAAATELPEVLAGMGDVAASVAVAGVDVATASPDSGGDSSANARLTWTWPLAEEMWTYDTSARLVLTGGQWRVEWSRQLVEPSLGDTEVLDLTSLAARRGDIIGAGGARLVTAREVRRFGIDKNQVSGARATASAKRLARLVDVDPADYAARVRSAGDRAFVEAIVYRLDDVPEQVAAAVGDIPGALVLPDRIPLAPTPTFAAPILGRVGEVTAELIEEHPDLYQAGDVAGLSGLEARYDEQLRGTPGALVRAVASDDKTRTLFRARPAAGQPLRLTLSEPLQRAAEAALVATKSPAALVAIRPSDGAVLAAANGEATGGVNLATYGQAAPGSTFKMVSTLALLRAGLTAESRLPCTSSIVVDGKTFSNYSDYPPSGLGRIPLRTALANSCNTAFISHRGKVPDRGLVEAAASLGFGIDHDLGFPAYFGQIEPPASETEAAADLIGQGAVLASPLVMATVIGSIQAGRTVVPRLIEDVEVSVPDEAAPLTSGEASSLQRMLRGVVTDGSGQGLLDVPGPPVLAKTGTAEFDQDGKRLTHAWMVAAQGDLAVAVYVDVGESGSRTAGPILEQFLRAAN